MHHTPLHRPRTARCSRSILAIVLGLAACTHAVAAARDDASIVAEAVMSRDAYPLPRALPGVWQRDNKEGRAACTRYRAIPQHVGETDEGFFSMLGGLVITPGLIHAYAEHGEGDFHVVKAMHATGSNAWTVDVETGWDALPGDGVDSMDARYRLELKRGRIIWQQLGRDDAEPKTYFRCGDVRPDLYWFED